MSLTSVLSDRNNQELRDKLIKHFSRPEFKLQSNLKAPPRTNHWGLVGTAFDYLMRFNLEFYNSSIIVEGKPWIADYAYTALLEKIATSESEDIYTGVNKNKVYTSDAFKRILSSQYDQTKTNYETFLTNGVVTDTLISNTLFLAKLDVYFRTGIIDQDFDFYNFDDVLDLRSLISLVDISRFKAKQKVYLNPTFGIGSALVGGADADLIVDNTLIDIKVTKHLKLDRDYLNQIIGYYILSLIGGVNGEPDFRPIQNVGIYFARHGELWIVPIDTIGSQSEFIDFKEWFMSYMANRRETLIGIKN